jgi:hypothetical protein
MYHIDSATRREILIITLANEGAEGFTYMRIVPGFWAYSDGGPNMEIIDREGTVKELEAAYARFLQYSLPK